MIYVIVVGCLCGLFMFMMIMGDDVIIMFDEE